MCARALVVCIMEPIALIWSKMEMRMLDCNHFMVEWDLFVSIFVLLELESDLFLSRPPDIWRAPFFLPMSSGNELG